MTQRFSFQKKKRASPGRRPFLFRSAVVFLLIFSFVFLLSSVYFHKITLSLARKEAETYVSRRLAAVVRDTLGKSSITYSDLIRLSYKNDGTVAALETDYFRCHALCSEAALAVAEALRNPHRVTVSIPIGNLTGIAFLSDKGPDLSLSVQLQGGFTAYLKSSFTEMGINQTRHKIELSLEIDIALLFPGNRRDTSATVHLPIAETVLLGDVPDAFTQIDRLTDDITEDDIEDIYDFGANQ